MTSRGVGSLLFTAGAGAAVTMAGLYLARRLRNTLRKRFGKKPKMKLFHNHLHLSTRCTWLISELGAEGDFEPAGGSLPAAYPEDRNSPVELLMLQDAETCEQERRRHQLQYGELVPYSPWSSHDEDLVDYDLDYEVGGGGVSLSGATSSSCTLPSVIVNDEYTLIEGVAICMYLADMYGTLLPQNEHKAEYYSWIVYSAATFDNLLKTLQQQLVDVAEHHRDEDLLRSARHGFDAFARALSSTLDGRLYLCGQRFTAADCVLGFTLWWAFTIDHGSLLKEHPTLMAYLDRLRDRPAFQKTFGISPDDWDWARYFRTYARGIQR